MLGIGDKQSTQTGENPRRGPRCGSAPEPGRSPLRKRGFARSHSAARGHHRGSTASYHSTSSLPSPTHLHPIGETVAMVRLKKVYLAGPEVFLPDAIDIATRKKRL